MSFKENLCKHTGNFLKSCVKHNGMFLFVTAAAGWALASAAQTIGLIANKDISKEEKKFLVPQEILDATFNILSYVAVSLPLMKGAKALTKHKFPGQSKVIEGANTLGAIMGGVVSSNIITPLLRNKTGVIVKNKMEEKNLKFPAPNIYDAKTYPNFKAKTQPVSMQGYIANIRTNGALKI